MARAFDPERHCGGHRPHPRPGPCVTGCHSDAAQHQCTKGLGEGTAHVGIGRCKWHGGMAPNANAGAQRELAVRAVTKLGIPLGSGDPFLLLEHTVQHAEGNLAAAAAALVETAGYVEANKADAPKPLIEDIKIAADIYSEAIKTAGRTGKAAVDAKVADRQVAVDLAMAGLLNRFLGELFERFLPKEIRPAGELWAKARLEELAAEYERSGRMH